MRVIYSWASPEPIVGTSRNAAPAPEAGFAPAATPAPAATVEISSAARGAHSKGEPHAPAHKIRPLNIIWGNSPK